MHIYVILPRTVINKTKPIKVIFGLAGVLLLLLTNTKCLIGPQIIIFNYEYSIFIIAAIKSLEARTSVSYCANHSSHKTRFVRIHLPLGDGDRPM